MKHLFLSLLLLPIFSYLLSAQEDIRQTVRLQLGLIPELENAREGFGKAEAGQRIEYHSSRADCNDALIVRSTDGNMELVLTTPEIKLRGQDGDLLLFYMVGMSQSGYKMGEVDPGFRVFINDKPFFHFFNRMGEAFECKGDQDSYLRFTSVAKDQHGDLFGYLRLKIPKKELGTAGKVKVKIIGDKADSQHWFMVFTCGDALEWFKNKAAEDDWLNLKATKVNNHMVVTAHTPDRRFPQKLQLFSDKRRSIDLLLKDNQDGTLRFEGDIPLLKEAGTEKWMIRKGDSDFSSLFGFFDEFERTDIQDNHLLYQKAQQNRDHSWNLEISRLSSNISKDLHKIADSHFNRGTFHIIASSHQDIAWMDSPEQCVIDRDELLITPAIEKVRQNEHYFNDMEDILMLREYLERHPDKYQEIYDLALKGRITWGASFTQPYEEMYFGEPLVRQFYLGKKWFEDNFKGCQTSIYWNVDVPGRTLQMPQILAKSGVDKMVISRHDEGLFYWTAPDGSKVLTYSPGHYYNGYLKLKKGFFETVGYLSDQVNLWNGYYGAQTKNPVMPILSDADMAVPDSYFEYIDVWQSMSNEKLKLPELKHSTMIEFFNDALATGAQFPTIRGERPAVWLYIHGPSHFQALKAARSAGRLIPSAEKIASWDALINSNLNVYPAGKLQNAWESAIYPDHGWGGNKGDITDSTFQAKFEQADQVARELIIQSVSNLSEKIETPRPAIAVFNSLSWIRTEPVQAVLTGLPDRLIRNLTVSDTDGAVCQWEFVGNAEFYPSGYLKKAIIQFIAHDVPPHGYKTFFIGSSDTKQEEDAFTGFHGEISNQWFDVAFGLGGISSVKDKEFDKELWLTDQFFTGELFSMHSEGNGAGEFADIQQPDMEGFEKIGDFSGEWKLERESALSWSISRYARMKHNRAKITWIIYKTIKRMDVRVDLIDWDGAAFREFRLAFPVNMQQQNISYEVPFGVLQVGRDELQQAAGERYQTNCKDVHPRGIGNWISVSDGKHGITFSSDVAVWDYVNPTTLPTQAVLMQPILLASRQSCHGLGPLYHQTGSHSMVFSVFSHEGDWTSGFKNAQGATEPMVTQFIPDKQYGLLKSSDSFLQLDDPLTLCSAFKKADDGDGWVVRIYNLENKSKQVRMSFPFILQSIQSATMIEEPIESLPCEAKSATVTLGPYSIETYLVRGL